MIFRHPFREGGAGSRDLLRRTACRYSGLTPDALGPVDQGPWGKPFFPQVPGLHCSVTHSGGWWMCALAPCPVGLDLQEHRSYVAPAKLSARFFHPWEDTFLAREDYRSFYRVWSAKESYVKYRGRGFSLDPQSFSVVSREGKFPGIEGVWIQELPCFPDYSLVLCTHKPMQVCLLSL